MVVATAIDAIQQGSDNPDEIRQKAATSTTAEGSHSYCEGRAEGELPRSRHIHGGSPL